MANLCVLLDDALYPSCYIFSMVLCQAIIWKIQGDDGPHEASLLKLDCSKLKSRMGWMPHWTIQEAVKKTVEWYQMYIVSVRTKDDAEIVAATMKALMEKQIAGVFCCINHIQVMKWISAQQKI